MTHYGMAIDTDRCTGCQTCVVICQMNHNQRPGIAWGTVDFAEGAIGENVDRIAIPHACMHCENAPCVEVCPTGASIQSEDGIVTIDYETCIGCGMCLTACVYGARKIKAEEEWYFGASEPAPYEAYGTPHFNVAEKCIFCADRLEQGLMPACVENCLTKARVFGDLDDPGSDISKFIQEKGAVALPGTSMYYALGNHGVDLNDILVVNAEPQEENA